MAEVVVAAAPWAFGALFNAAFKERCTATIADTLLRDDKEDGKWLFTSKKGEVQRKRTVVAANVRERFTRLGLAISGNVDGYVCTVRYDDGRSQFLGQEAFGKMIGSWPPSDPSILAAQCFVAGTVYRNTYERVGDEGRIKTATVVINTTPDDSAFSGTSAKYPVRAYGKSRATRLNETLDAATLSIVGYVERTQRVKVKQVYADYVIDDQNQLWLCWLGDARCTPPRLAETPGASTDGARPRTADSARTEVKELQYLDGTAHDQVQDASGLVETERLRDRLNQSKGRASGKTTGPPSKFNDENEESWPVRYDAKAADTRSQYPTEFACRGDYCSVAVHDPKQLFTEKELKGLTQPELAKLRKLLRDANTLQHGDAARLPRVRRRRLPVRAPRLQGEAGLRAGPGVEERRRPELDGVPDDARDRQLGFEEAKDDGDDARRRVEDPRRQRRDERLRDGSQLMAPTTSSTTRNEWPALRGELDGGTANMYRRVKVCRNCFGVYNLLDSARDMLGRDARAEKFQQEVKAKKPKLLQDHRGGGNGVDLDGGESGALAAPPADGGELVEAKQPRRGKPPKPQPARSWKGRLPESELYGEEVPATAMQKNASAKFEALDEYLRGTSDAAARKAEAKAAATARSRAAQAKIAEADGEDPASLYFGRILIVEERDSVDLEAAVSALEDAGFLVDVELDVRQAREVLVASHVDTAGAPGWQYDAVLVSDVLDMGDAFDVVKEVRTLEKAQRLRESKRLAEQTKAAAMRPGGSRTQDQRMQAQTFTHLPVVVFSGRTSPEDLRAYKGSGMDGCISKPLNRAALLSTMRAAGMTPDDIDTATLNAFCAEISTQLGVATSRVVVDGVSGGSVVVKLRVARAFVRALRARSQLVDEDSWGRHAIEDVTMTASNGAVETGEEASSGAKALVAGAFGTSGATGSSAMAAKSLALPASFTSVDGSVGGMLQLDADTALPYCVVDLSLASDGSRPPGATEANTFNLVVCHDFFDTFERLKIVLAPIAARYPGLQVLLWNYPGQAFSEWREEQLLNNVFMASCLNELLTHVGHRGTNQFDDERPFYLLGYGYGASIASFFATHYRAAARFLFSREYLTKVSTPLALNLYTAVHNPITLQGRMQLCIGALSSHDVRPMLKTLDLPVITVHSTQGVLVKPSHAQSWTDAENGMEPCTTIHQALKSRRTCVIWVKSGHELFQEVRKQVSILIEQLLLVGYHELNDVAFVPAEFADGDAAADESRKRVVRTPGGTETTVPQTHLKGKLEGDGVVPDGHGNFEDNFIDNLTASQRTSHSLDQRNQGVEEKKIVNAKKSWQREKEQALKTVLDPANPAFERQDNVVYAMGQGSRIYPTPQDYPEVKEYMGWRLKRNRKRLQRLDYSARVIQAAFRNHLAWMVVRRLREERATTCIQRAYRGWRGRQAFLVKMRQIWAAHVIQRAWRGYAGRGFFTLLKTMHAASAQLQRCARGFLARMLVQRMQRRRNKAATMMQTLWRVRALATFELRNRVLAARAMQRVYRGHLGRRRAQNERHKFLFSKSQSQGIEFGRQMLLEHKLHATLQSEVSLLTQEKVAAEESVEALLEEISEFEQGVTQLEKEMHQLSRIESEAVGVLDEEAKAGGAAPTLERKLVVLLEEQQRELHKIRRRQEARGELLDNARAGDANAIAGGAGGGEGGAGYAGPSMAEKKQAAQLMQSTETLMKFGFMSMSMTYFSSLNMIRAMRTVSTQDTVMAALHANQNGFGGPQGGGGGGGGGGNAMANMPYEDKAGGEMFKPSLKPGQMPGQETLKVSAWSVDDVARWLQTLSLGQYREAFVDAAVDGAFLYDLDDDDLRNTLGIEHRLHRKKILNMTNKLRASETERNKQMRIFMTTGQPGGAGVGQMPLDTYARAPPEGAATGTSTALVPAGGGGGDEAAAEAAPVVLNFDEIQALVRHGKAGRLKDALASLPNKRFDPSIVKVAYVEDFGTAYVDAYEREPFNLNKVDQHGNSMLLTSAQNGNEKIAKILINKGANPNHQNKTGQTAGHYANAYQFYDYMSWLFDPEGGNADDTLENMYGLGVYDGLSVRLEDGRRPPGCNVRFEFVPR
ncbi:hypothetical protein JL721_11031 [Aureococcus anophagefferens]|nr:hypothetical protein JL721_11031 [Aureococcus anophagefferens]